MTWKIQKKLYRKDIRAKVEKTSGLGIGEAGKVSASTLEDELEAVQSQPRSRYDYPQGRKLACGCTVFYAAHVMNASLGTSCQDCYDRMSDC